jgi:hypothetical protein
MNDKLKEPKLEVSRALTYITRETLGIRWQETGYDDDHRIYHATNMHAPLLGLTPLQMTILRRVVEHEGLGEMSYRNDWDGTTGTLKVPEIELDEIVADKDESREMAQLIAGTFEGPYGMLEAYSVLHNATAPLGITWREKGEEYPNVLVAKNLQGGECNAQQKQMIRGILAASYVAVKGLIVPRSSDVFDTVGELTIPTDGAPQLVLKDEEEIKKFVAREFLLIHHAKRFCDVYGKSVSTTAKNVQEKAENPSTEEIGERKNRQIAKLVKTFNEGTEYLPFEWKDDCSNAAGVVLKGEERKVEAFSLPVLVEMVEGIAKKLGMNVVKGELTSPVETPSLAYLSANYGGAAGKRVYATCFIPWSNVAKVTTLKREMRLAVRAVRNEYGLL